MKQAAIVFAVFVGFLVAAWFIGDAASKVSGHPARKPAPIADAAAVAGYQQQLTEARNVGLIHRIEEISPGFTRLIVGPNFYGTSFDSKQGICFMVGLVHQQGDGRLGDVILKDYRTNKTIGMFQGGRLEMN